MILKIERYRGNERWWMVDKIDRIASSLRLEYDTDEKRKEAQAGCPDLILLDFPKCGCSIESKTGCSECKDIPDDYCVCRLKCRLENGNDYSILFDTILYVLNDNGKTIEKIVVNYKQ